MKLLAVCLVLVSASGLGTSAFDCTKACEHLQVSEETSSMFQVNVDKYKYRPGDNVKVTMVAYNNTFQFKAVIVQAVAMGDFSPVGAMTPGPDGHTFLSQSCGGVRDDTVCVSAEDPLDVVTTRWSPPGLAGQVRHVEIQALFMDMDGTQHPQHSILLSEDTDIPEEEEEEKDLHDDKDEAEQAAIAKEKEQHMIDLENLATEDDEVVKRLQEKKDLDREHLWEETEYERILKEEADELRRRIEAELADKEEYDRLEWERKEREEREREEREREEREREEREREEREREENDTSRENEIDIDDDDSRETIFIVADGAPRLVVASLATIAASVLVFFL